MYRNVVCGKIHIPSQKVICVFCSTVCLLEDNNNVNDYLLLSDYHITGCENYDFLPHRIFKYIFNITTENTRDFVEGLSLGFVNVIDLLLIHLD